jgi:hypothetical protein
MVLGSVVLVPVMDCASVLVCKPFVHTASLVGGASKGHSLNLLQHQFFQ